VDPRAGVDDVEKKKFSTLVGPELRPPQSPVAIQTALTQLLFLEDSTFHICCSKRRRLYSFIFVADTKFHQNLVEQNCFTGTG
jgi:hypothetical protein